MGTPTHTEAEIGDRHKARVAVLLEKYKDIFAVPRDEIDKLQAENKQDWIQHIAERDGRTGDLKKLLTESDTTPKANKKRPAKSSSAPAPAPARKPAKSEVTADVAEINEGLDAFIKH